jgi:hypothetical protein
MLSTGVFEAAARDPVDPTTVRCPSSPANDAEPRAVRANAPRVRPAAVPGGG